MKKRNFPDGTKIAQYGKYTLWTPRRWAWEFLCRNKDFISESPNYTTDWDELPIAT